MTQPTVKILVGYHKPAQLLKDDVLVPIHLGRALATQTSKDGQMSHQDYQWMLDNMIGDDTGDNISKLNREFCELTGIYWAWKNYDKLGNPDYIGFMHYRRHFIFNNEFLDCQKNKFGLCEFDYLTEEYKKLAKLDDKNITSFIKNNVADFYITNRIVTPYSVWEHFKKDLAFLNEHDLEICREEIVRCFPNYSDVVEDYFASNINYWYGSFIMKKDLFFEYCHWLFDILFHMEKKIDRTNYTKQSNRILAFCAERLLGIFYSYQKTTTKYELAMSFIKNTNINKDVYPVKQENNIAICFSCNNTYLTYLSTTLESLIANRNNKSVYDITVLYTELSSDRCNLIKQTYERDNVFIRFLNVSSLLKKYQDLFYISGHISTEAYYRFLIPEIFKFYEKVLYLDCDLIINCDVAKLYNMDISNYLLGACKDVEIIRFYIADNLKHYLLQILGLKDYTKYFNSGVILFNIKACLAFELVDKLFKCLKEIGNPKFWDQDVFNCVCENKVYEIDQAWNTQWRPYMDNMQAASFQLPEFVYDGYMDALNKLYIIHYTSNIKPWNTPGLPLANFWWHYARMTPFYEEIVYQNTKTKIQPPVISKKILNEIFNYSKNRRKYIKYKIISKIIWGKKRKKYKQKKRNLKIQLKEVRQFFKK